MKISRNVVIFFKTQIVMFNPIQKKTGLLYIISIKNKVILKSLYSGGVNTL